MLARYFLGELGSDTGHVRLLNTNENLPPEPIALHGLCLDDVTTVLATILLAPVLTNAARVCGLKAMTLVLFESRFRALYRGTKVLLPLQHFMTLAVQFKSL